MRLNTAQSFDLSFLQTLCERRVRDQTGLALVEGERFVITALTTRTEVAAVIAGDHRRKNPTLDKLIARHVARGGALVRMRDAELESICWTKEPHGVAAVVRQEWSPLPAGRAGPNAVWLAFETLQSEGNLGTALRTAAAAGARGLILLGDEIDPYDPRIVRATMGAIFFLRLSRTTPRELARWKYANRAFIVGTSAHAHRDYRTIDHRRPIVLMMGCERGGLSAAQRELCDTLVRIPMTGRVDSLNVAVAASLMLYEVFRVSVEATNRLDPARRIGYRRQRAAQERHPTQGHREVAEYGADISRDEED